MPKALRFRDAHFQLLAVGSPRNTKDKEVLNVEYGDQDPSSLWLWYEMESMEMTESNICCCLKDQATCSLFPASSLSVAAARSLLLHGCMRNPL